MNERMKEIREHMLTAHEGKILQEECDFCAENILVIKSPKGHTAR